MATRDRRIQATLGSVTRTVGHDVQDIAALERRRQQADRLLRPNPTLPFAQVLATQGAPQAELARRPDTAAQPAASAANEVGEAKQPAAASAAQAARPGRGKGRIIRG